MAGGPGWRVRGQASAEASPMAGLQRPTVEGTAGLIRHPGARLHLTRRMATERCDLRLALVCKPAMEMNPLAFALQ